MKVSTDSIPVREALERINLDLDTRLVEIDDFLTKYEEMHSLYSEFDSMITDFKKNNKKFLIALDESNNMAGLLELVLTEMKKGITSDY